MDDKSEIKEAKRLHVSNIPFRFRDPDLRQMFGVSIFTRLSLYVNWFFFIWRNLVPSMMSRLFSMSVVQKDSALLHSRIKQRQS